MKTHIYVKSTIFILIIGTFSIIFWNGQFPSSFNSFSFAPKTTSWHVILRPNSLTGDNKLGNFTDFEFQSENEKFCRNQNIFMLIFVASAPQSSDIRNMYRRALLDLTEKLPELKIKMLFPFGAFQNQTQQKILETEIDQHRDIIQGNFDHSSRNVTLRDLMSLRWAWKHCSQTKYIMHLEDDTVFKMCDLIDSLNEHCQDFPAFIACYSILNKSRTNNYVYRSGPYGLSEEEYPSDKFPDYCDGKMYVLSPLMTYLLDQTALDAQQYWISDAYITGSLVEKLNIKHIDLQIKASKHDKNKRDMVTVN